MWSHLLAFGPNLDVESSLKLQPAANNWGAITSKSWDSIILLGLHNFHTSPDNLQEIIPAIQLADVMVVMLFIIHSLIHFLPTGIPSHFPALMLPNTCTCFLFGGGIYQSNACDVATVKRGVEKGTCVVSVLTLGSTSKHQAVEEEKQEKKWIHMLWYLSISVAWTFSNSSSYEGPKSLLKEFAPLIGGSVRIWFMCVSHTHIR